MTISSCIAPVRRHRGPGILEGKPRTFTFTDNTTTVYPKLPGGGTCRVVIIRRSLASSYGAVFHVCRNAGKWSFRIDYPFKKGTTRMTQ